MPGVTDPRVTDPRVAVYIDFDNIVISRYDQLHGKQAWRSDNARSATPGDRGEIGAKLTAATVDVGAILDYASSYGTVAVSRAYADWSVPANASYRRQLVDRAVDLTQLFTTTKAGKNGADIRLSVDVLEDLFRLPDLTHVVIVAGDSDYIALAQRCKRLGRFVVGIGVAGGTSPALIAACDEYELYDAIPKGDAESDGDGESDSSGSGSVPPEEPGVVDDTVSESTQEEATGKLSDRAASRLLVRALELGHAKDDDEWLHAASVKSQIKRLDPSFNEKLLGFSTFTDFVSSRGNLAEVKIDGNQRYVRSRQEKTAKKTRRSSAASG